MATREGIYVGGHEIIERYVGSRLVWEKLDLIIKTEAVYYKINDEVSFVKVGSDTSEVERLLKSADSIMIAGTLFTKITITGSFSESFNAGYKILSYKLIFRDSREKSAFLSLINFNNSGVSGIIETKFYKKKEVI